MIDRIKFEITNDRMTTLSMLPPVLWSGPKSHAHPMLDYAQEIGMTFSYLLAARFYVRACP